MTRRKLLKLGAAGAGAALVAGGIGFVYRDPIMRLQAGDFQDLVFEAYPYLNIEVSEEDFGKFYELYIEHYKHMARPIWLKLKGYDDEHINTQLDAMLITFLLSTDFFLNGEDESKPVRYQTFAQPYLSPCWNPISLAAAARAAGA